MSAKGNVGTFSAAKDVATTPHAMMRIASQTLPPPGMRNSTMLLGTLPHKVTQTVNAWPQLRVHDAPSIGEGAMGLPGRWHS